MIIARVAREIGIPLTMLLELPASEIDMWIEIYKAESSIDTEKTTADGIRDMLKGKNKHG